MIAKRLNPSGLLSFGKVKIGWYQMLAIAVILAASSIDCRAETPIPIAQIPSLLSAIRNIDRLTFCGEPAPLEDALIRERFEKELLLILWNRPQVLLWIKRSARIFPEVEKMLNTAGLPDDLKYVAVVESALQPHVRSSKGAVGFWQFIKSTGKKYGLRIDRHIDERRNLVTATRAATAYFKDLYGIFGSWTLAAAAYNMGEQGLQSEVLIQQIDDYYNLYLPRETQRYIFRILAAKMIIEKPQYYGFLIAKDDLYDPLVTDQFSLSMTDETPVQALALAARTSFKRIKELNPQIRGHYLAPGTHNLSLPAGAAKGFNRRLMKEKKKITNAQKNRIYIVRKGDSLTGIAKQFGVPLPALLIWNRLDYRKPIHPGDRLVIHP